MGLTHVAMRKLGFLFDFPCGLFYISLFREAQGCNKCLVLRGNVRSSFQVDFAAAAKGGGGREVEEKRGRGSKARQGSSGPNLPGKQRPTRESLYPTVPYTECRMLAPGCSTGTDRLKQPDGGAPGLLLALAPSTTRQALRLLLLLL